MKKSNRHVGSSLDDFLKEEGVLEATRAVALKETLAWQVQQAMEKENITKVEMARWMNTSRAAKVSNSELARRIGVTEAVVRRMLDPAHKTKALKLHTALEALGTRLIVSTEAA